MAEYRFHANAGEGERAREKFQPRESAARVSHHHNVQLAAKHTPAFHLSEVRDYKSDVICELNYCCADVARSRSSIHKEQNRRGDRNEIRMTNVGGDIIQQTEDAEDTWGMQMTNEWVRSAVTVVSQLKKIITVLLIGQPWPHTVRQGSYHCYGLFLLTRARKKNASSGWFMVFSLLKIIYASTLLPRSSKCSPHMKTNFGLFMKRFVWFVKNTSCREGFCHACNVGGSSDGKIL